jgi:TPR repeat protein
LKNLSLSQWEHVGKLVTFWRSANLSAGVKESELVYRLRGFRVAVMARPFFRRLFSPARPISPDAVAGEAPRGEAEACFAHGVKLDSGVGEAQDSTAAARCYREAADRSYAPAQFKLGILYSEGRGVPKDDAQAVLWIDKAAQQGLADAQFNLGMRHYRTLVQSRVKDLPESRIEAYKWLRLAGAQDFPDAEGACDRVVLCLSYREVAEGNQRVTVFLEEHPTMSRGGD